MERTVCTLPKAAGSCADWTARFHYDVIAGKCVHFWYGNCHGNNNNFLTRAECQQACPSGPASAQWTPGPAPIDPASRGPASRPPAGGATSVSTSTAVGGGGATPGVGRDMGGVFTAPGGAGVTRQGGNAASHAHRARLHLRPRRPTFGTAAQSAGPAAR